MAARKPGDLTDWSLEDLASEDSQPGSQKDKWVQAELTRRQINAQLEASTAAKDTAQYTEQSARYILASVIVLALASVAQLIVSILSLVMQ